MISSFSVSSMLCFSHIMSMIFSSSSVRMLVYMLEMSSEASFKLGLKGISDRSFISWTEFWTL